MSAVLEVKHLKAYFYLREGVLKAVNDVSFSLPEKKTLGLIGESGCGKSVTALSVLRLVAPPGRCIAGEINLRCKDGSQLDLMKLAPRGKEIRRIRGGEIAMIFQEPMSSLSPVYTIGQQIIESLALHVPGNKQLYREMALDLINQVGIPNPAQRIDQYPHHLSGGLRQRAMIAMALSCKPSVLVADEPTTALDVTVQAQILDLLRRLQESFGMSVLFITHDLGVIAEIADMTAVMYLGQIVEYARTSEIYRNPLHPYTIGLLKATLSVKGVARTRLSTIPGMVPLAIDRPAECGFRSRCAAFDAARCMDALPGLKEIEDMHFVRCFLHHGETEAPSEQ
jgi:oligopeptide/dipeptide ABC transporter ATP-binding protein